MAANSFELSGYIVDVLEGRVIEGTVQVKNGIITGIREHPVNEKQWILPGLIDAHVHIESSLLIPSEFARLAIIHGTTGAVSDPHEIANVLGAEGVRFMIRNGKKVPFRFAFGAPSCVPATHFETTGAIVDEQEVDGLLGMDEVKYLSEMMNFPGVLAADPGVMAKLKSARAHGKPVDGHAPGLSGEDVKKYIDAGISTDHECFTLHEALEKIGLGMKILIREGSAARNFEELCPLIGSHPDRVMLCSDDKHPDDLVQGHINRLVKRALDKGYNFMDVLRTCTLNPVRHYGLYAGLLQPGDPADLVVIGDPSEFNVLSVFIGGIQVAEEGRTLIPHTGELPFNKFVASEITPDALHVPWSGGKVKVIQAYDGQLITGVREYLPWGRPGNLVSEPADDVLKLVVKDRYRDMPPSVAFVSGFGLERGAIASSIAHDSHNVIATGVDDVSIARAVNRVIAGAGGIALVDGDHEYFLPLPFAGIMSGEDGFTVAEAYQNLDQQARALGSTLRAPFMTLSFMALLVIPELKLSDRGLFDGKKFRFTALTEF